jgi:hypothetical protein
MASKETNLLGRQLGNSDVAVGRLVAVSVGGEPMVDFAGNELGPIPARFLEAVDLSDNRRGSAVLLLFENGNPNRPIIVGNVLNALPKRSEGQAPMAVADDRRILIEARSEIELRCGKSSIVLKNDGKVIVRGSEITSRASGVNRVRGAAVKIN